MLVQDRCTCGGAPGISARPRSGAVMPLMSRPVNLTVHRRRPVLVTVAVLIALLVGYAAVAVTRASAASPLLSQGKPAIASSVENAGLPASAAVDGNTGTRWSSAFSDPQWLQVDLGSTTQVCRVGLNWEAAFGRAFQIQLSNDANTWSNVYATTSATGGNQTLDVTGSGRYLRVYGTARATQYGYSLWELTVNTDDGGTGPAVPPTDPRNPNFGPNVFVFDPSTPQGTIQSRLTTIATQMKTNQFGTQRYAVLFKPGTYNADVDLRFYTQVAGLGLLPDQVNINGH